MGEKQTPINVLMTVVGHMPKLQKKSEEVEDLENVEKNRIVNL